MKFLGRGILIFCSGSNADVRTSPEAGEIRSGAVVVRCRVVVMLSGGEIRSDAVSGALTLGSK